MGSKLNRARPAQKETRQFFAGALVFCPLPTIRTPGTGKRLTHSRWLFLSFARDWVGVVSNGAVGLIWDTVASFIGCFCAGNWFVVVTSIVKILTMSPRRAPGYPHCSSLLPL